MKMELYEVFEWSRMPLSETTRDECMSGVEGAEGMHIDQAECG